MSTSEPGPADPAGGASSDAAESAVPRATPLRAVHEGLGTALPAASLGAPAAGSAGPGSDVLIGFASKPSA